MNRRTSVVFSLGATVVIIVAAVALFMALKGRDDGESGSGKPTADDPGSVSASANEAVNSTRLTVTPSTVLLTAVGETRQLKATLPDGSDPGEVTWKSNDPTTISVSAHGVVQARGWVGSALITAAVNGRQSPPVLVYIAQPVDGAALVEDGQVIGEPEDAAETPDGSYLYTVRLRDIDKPKPGTIVIGTGQAPVGGRVVEASKDGGATQVTLKVVPPEEMFTRIVIDEDFDLAYGGLDIPQEVLDVYDVVRLPDGTFEFLPKQESAHTLAENAFFASLPLQSQTLYLLGPFECETTLPRLPISLSQPGSFTVDANLSVSLLIRDRFEHLILDGKPRATITVKPVVNVAFEAEVECKLELFEYTIPVGGPLSLLFGGQVPVGVGMGAEGKVTLAQAGFEITGQAGADFRLGVACASGLDCSMVNEFKVVSHGSVKWVVPDFEKQFRIEPTIGAFVYAELEIGTKFSRRLRFDALELTAGMAQDANLAPVAVQAADSGYASEYQLKLKGEAEAGRDLQDWLELLNIRELKLKAEIVLDVLSRSPTGAASANVDKFEAGDTVRFKVSLDSENAYYAVVGFNVDEVAIYRRNGDEMEKIASVAPQDGLADLSLEWVADRNGSVENEFFAFALTSVLPAPEIELAAVKPGSGSTAAPTPGPIFAPHECQVLKPYIRAPDGSTLQYEHFAWRDGTRITAKRTITTASGVLEETYEMTATYVWKQPPEPDVWVQEWKEETFWNTGESQGVRKSGGEGPFAPSFIFDVARRIANGMPLTYQDPYGRTISLEYEGCLIDRAN